MNRFLDLLALLVVGAMSLMAFGGGLQQTTSVIGHGGGGSGHSSAGERIPGRGTCGIDAGLLRPASQWR